MPPEPDLSNAVLSSHAVEELARRGISEADVRWVLEHAGQLDAVRPGRVVVASLHGSGELRTYVLKVFVDIDRVPPVVVTAYRSSKIAKYWRQP